MRLSGRAMNMERREEFSTATDRPNGGIRRFLIPDTRRSPPAHSGARVTLGGHCNNCRIRRNRSFRALYLSFNFTPGQERASACRVPLIERRYSPSARSMVCFSV